MMGHAHIAGTVLGYMSRGKKTRPNALNDLLMS